MDVSWTLKAPNPNRNSNAAVVNSETTDEKNASSSLFNNLLVPPFPFLHYQDMKLPPRISALATAICIVPGASTFALNGAVIPGQARVSSTSLAAGLTLYGSQGSRSPLCNWGAYELGVDISMGDLAVNPHPFGQIPCLVDEDTGDAVVFESGAILSYLYLNADTGDDKKRTASILSWIAWANASLDPVCFLETPQGKVYDTGLKQPNKRIDRLDAILADREVLVDGGFSIADVAIASYLLYVPQFFQGIDLSRWPNVVRYMRDCASRDAYGKAFGPQVQQALVQSMEAQMGGSGSEKKLFGMF